MIVLKVITSFLLTFFPIAILIRDWKFHDKRTNKHHNITRIIIIFWFIGSIMATIFVWADSAKINELIEGKNTLISQNENLSKKLDKYQKDLYEKEKKIKELEKAALPRNLNEEQRSKLLQLLSFKSDFQIGVVCKAFDTESFKYAEQITNIFKSSNWQVIKINQSYLDNIKSDLGIITTDRKQLETAEKIMKIFNTVGINCKFEKIRKNSLSSIKENTIYLIVGSKLKK